MMRVRRFLHILLLTGVIALLWQVVATWRRPLPELNAAALSGAEAETPLPPTPALVPPGASKQLADVIAEKDLFSPSRSRAVVEETVTVKETVPPPSHLKLVGVFLTPKREEAFFIDSSQGGKVVRAKRGEALGAYQLVQVTPQNVTMTMGQDGGEVELPLSLLDSGTAVRAPRLMPAVPRPGAARPGQAQAQAGKKPEPIPPAVQKEVGIRQDILRLQQRLRQIRQKSAQDKSDDDEDDDDDDEEDDE
ncbi:MAG: hypothetical protein HY268_10195 [Deltaproteobacteria bacterium]|nr:hypothetical protein [Deltaproteobacteria bacterium]